MYRQPESSGLRPVSGPMEGGTRVTVEGGTFFPSSEAVVRLVTAPLTELPREEEPSTQVEGEEGEKAANDEAVKPDEPPPPPPLPEGGVWQVPASCKSVALTFTLPALPGVGILNASIAMNGINFVPIPGDFLVYGVLSVESLTPPFGALRGGTSLELRGKGIGPSPNLSVCFVKGAWRAEVPASFSAELGCAQCTTPPYGGAAKEGADDMGDCIVEISLNGQQWSWSSQHFSYLSDPEIEAVDPPAGAIEGGTAVKLKGKGFRPSELLAARFTRTNLEINAAAPESVVVVAKLAESGMVECTTPKFEGVDAPFETTVQLSLDGQVFGAATEGGIFKFEPTGKGAAKKKK